MEQHPQAERVLSLECSKGSEDGIGFDVVDARDAEAVRLSLTLAQGGGEHVIWRDRQGWKRQLYSPLEQQAGRLAVGVANNSPAEGVRRPTVYTRCVERSAVKPGRVYIE